MALVYLDGVGYVDDGTGGDSGGGQQQPPNLYLPDPGPNYASSGYLGDGGGDWGNDAGSSDYPPIPPFSNVGIADDQSHPYDPIGTWGSYPVGGSQYDELNSNFSVPDSGHGFDNWFGSEFYPTWATNNPSGPFFPLNSLHLPQISDPVVQSDPAPDSRLGPPSYEDVGTDSNWQYLLSNSIWNGIPTTTPGLHDSFGNIWRVENGQWVLVNPNTKGSW